MARARRFAPRPPPPSPPLRSLPSALRWHEGAPHRSGHTFRCAGCIASLEYIEKHRVILSASADCRVKLWSIDEAMGGCLAGVLGDSPQWALDDPTTFKLVPQEPKPREPTTRSRQPTATATVAGGSGDAEDADADSDASGSEEDDSSDADQPEGGRVELNIAQLLSRTAKDASRRALHAPAIMHRLKIHELRDVSAK